MLADLSSVSVKTITNSLTYLREYLFIVTIGDTEYINPLYCYQCGPQILKELIQDIVEERTFYFKNQPCTKPAYWPESFSPDRINFIRNWLKIEQPAETSSISKSDWDGDPNNLRW